MRYIPVTCEEREAMLRAVGAESADALFAAVPPAARLGRWLDLPSGLPEIELDAHLRALAGRDRHSGELVSFAGAGSYDHYIPSVVDHVLRKPELFTAYTPYQPEVSQGTLQAIYEFQSMVCALTGLEVANASMYDGATAAVEAALMACRVTRKRRVVLAGTLHPEWQDVFATYAATGLFELAQPAGAGSDGRLTGPGAPPGTSAADLVDESTAALVVASPGFFGVVEDVPALAELARSAGALLVVAQDPILAGVLEAPGRQGADIVVGEGQSLGNPMSFGGPGLGLFACRSDHLRQMPGRVVGRTKDVDGRDAFVLTMQTREQHIRRERATSNICSNHALNALAAGVYLAAVGAEGLASIGRSCVSKAHYLREALLATGRFTSPWDAPFAREFALLFEGDAAAMRDRLLERGFLAGVPLSEVEPRRRTAVPLGADERERTVVFAVTEKRTREQMDGLAEAVRSL